MDHVLNHVGAKAKESSTNQVSICPASRQALANTFRYIGAALITRRLLYDARSARVKGRPKRQSYSVRGIDLSASAFEPGTLHLEHEGNAQFRIFLCSHAIVIRIVHDLGTRAVVCPTHLAMNWLSRHTNLIARAYRFQFADDRFFL